MRRLSGALAGYYVLFVEQPESRRATHDIEVELTRRKGHVIATSYVLGTLEMASRLPDVAAPLGPGPRVNI